jgi:NAD(P)-dependent dehydrogenase (short-subunit alcohol dehydrogenase family)
MDALAGKVAVVTGASRGIGRAVALHLAERGATVCVVGRCREALEAVANAAVDPGSIHPFEANLEHDDALRTLAREIKARLGRADVLVHCAGAYGRGTLHDTSVEQLDRLYKVNVRGPYVLTQRLLPLLMASRGQIVFINSSQGLEAAASVGQYAATKHALKAIADSLRQELNPEGVRVLTVYPGRTATPGMEEICRMEGKPYEPDLLLQPADVAAVIADAIVLPRTAEVTNLSIRPFAKAS